MEQLDAVQQAAEQRKQAAEREAQTAPPEAAERLQQEAAQAKAQEEQAKKRREEAEAEQKQKAEEARRHADLAAKQEEEEAAARRAAAGAGAATPGANDDDDDAPNWDQEEADHMEVDADPAGPAPAAAGPVAADEDEGDLLHSLAGHEVDEAEDARHRSKERRSLPSCVCVKKKGDLYQYKPLDRAATPIRWLFFVRIRKLRSAGLEDTAVLPVQLQKECQQELKKAWLESRNGKKHMQQVASPPLYRAHRHPIATG